MLENSENKRRTGEAPRSLSQRQRPTMIELRVPTGRIRKSAWVGPHDPTASRSYDHRELSRERGLDPTEAFRELFLLKLVVPGQMQKMNVSVIAVENPYMTARAERPFANGHRDMFESCYRRGGPRELH